MKILTLSHHQNKLIKIGDIVKIIDGSGLCCINYPENDYYIVNSYDILKTNEIIRHLPFEVIEINVTDKINPFSIIDIAYVLDIVILHKESGIKFRTCSEFVTHY